ncbi:type 1 fimbrial protein [Salmonella enterica]|uniref:fimbrial protein n=1 Tax=Enterobacter cloacae complex TaxID=354276 RepID=UPI0007B326CC|nr:MULTISPECIES: fimbrial protein [Enterobacter cloacae complex]EBS7633708.1 type 1 fimbrial protein [Salmonella enterica]ASD57544.1 adhesin [Enterobacter cloacae complex sp. ECNIH7]KZP93243.1 adhesin [Enterobacter asburiae]MBJ3796108.1 type 1 fimbrial protein [Enterobacter asburiae]POV42008.1 type 1 fimbrial protein [Enterobacter cloacae complex sp. ECNIH11]
MRMLLKSVGLVLALWSFSFVVQASCQFVNGVTAEIPGYISFGNIAVQRDAPVGSVIATATTGAYNGGNTIAGCTEAWTFRQELTKWQTLSAQGNGVYNTNVPGVGIRMTSPSGKVLPYDLPINANTYVNINGDGIKAELIKTGDITGGTLDTGMLARASVVNQFYIANVTLNGNNTITSESCTVTTPTVNVPMDDHEKSEFSGVGSTTDWVNFDIGLTCDVGARINVRIDAAADPSASSQGVMQLDSGGASGVGIQLHYRPDDATVQYGQERFYWQSVYGDEIVQLKARYYQTAQTITPGPANATATFTLTYK